MENVEKIANIMLLFGGASAGFFNRRRKMKFSRFGRWITSRMVGFRKCDNYCEGKCITEHHFSRYLVPLITGMGGGRGAMTPNAKIKRILVFTAP